MNVLFVTPWFPTPAVNGSKLRIYHLLKALAKEHTITLLSFVRDHEAVDPGGVSDLVARVKTAPWVEFQPNSVRALLALASRRPRSMATMYSRSMAQMVADELKQTRYDLLIASEGVTAPYVATAPLPKILDDFEAGSLFSERDKTHWLAGWRRRLTWIKSRRYWQGMIQAFDACTVVSEQEKRIVEEIVPGYGRARLVLNGVDTVKLKPGQANANEKRIIYNGALTYQANYDAARYFLKEIYPLVQREMRGIEFLITGSTQGVDTAGLGLGDGARLTGYLEDIGAMVASAWVSVVPLRVGGGTRVKILEAMALGTPVVATSKGAEGLDVMHEENILIADEPSEFARQVLRLLGDVELRKRLAENGRRLVEQKYDWGLIGHELVRLVDEVSREARRRCGK